jgi:hypothetical protein
VKAVNTPPDTPDTPRSGSGVDSISTVRRAVRPCVLSAHRPPGELTLAGLSGDTVVLVARVGCTLVVAWTLADLAAAAPFADVGLLAGGVVATVGELGWFEEMAARRCPEAQSAYDGRDSVALTSGSSFVYRGGG